MPLKILSLLVVITGLIYIISVFVYKMLVKKHKNIKTSGFIAFIAAALMLYVVFSILTAIFVPKIFNKVLMVLLAIIPFVIGKFAKYELENTYSLLQIVFISFSIAYILNFGSKYFLMSFN